MSNPFSLDGKTILITGASSGIGKSIAEICASMGAHLVISGRNEGRLQAVLEQLEGTGHIAIAGDLAEADFISSLVDRIPTLDGIVHCAGIGHRGLCRHISESDVDQVMGANFKSAVLLQSSILGGKKINKGGSIVFMASYAAEAPAIGNAVYSAAKGAIISYAKCLGLELAPKQIRVNCICPGMVWTKLIEEGGLDKATLQEEEKKYPLGRYGQPEDIAPLAVYLLSPASQWMTGSCININGGSMTL